ncbi:hypothetical protein RIR_jg8029.t1 [Rhizophagus irregularis DAOM 181602=DAOM 197198]|nr:hypothetical protein RIR_jg8029.t1 [Rhizophagus irregularis DAOM 181602=DAOM 197198]
MSENIVLSREELINNFMEKFGASFENFEYRILTKIYKIKSLKEFQEFNMKTFKTVSVDQINNAIAEKDKRIVRPPQAIYIVYFLLDWSASIIRKNFNEFLEKFPLPSERSNNHSHVSRVRR